MCGSLLLVATKLFGVTTGVITVLLASVPFIVIWFVMPLLRKARLNGSQPGSGEQLADQRRAGEPQVRRVP
jgi:hypothetical protein